MSQVCSGCFLEYNIAIEMIPQRLPLTMLTFTQMRVLQSVNFVIVSLWFSDMLHYYLGYFCVINEGDCVRYLHTYQSLYLSSINSTFQ